MLKLFYAASFATVLTLAGCQDTVKTKVDSPNGETQVIYNGSYDGCKIYYVIPAHGNSFSFVRCGNGITTTVARTTCGKNCYRDVQTDTVE